MKKYYKDYKLVSKTLPNGKEKMVAEYIGKYYVCQLSEIKFIRFKFYFFALVLCSGATAMGIGFLNNPGSRVAYVALPYVSLFLPYVFCLIGTISFMLSSNKLEQAAYDKTKIRIKRSTIWQIVLSCLTIIGDIIYILTNKEMLHKELIFTGSILFILIINIIFLKLQKKVIYQVKDPEISN